jgi:hypothetical protein
VHPLLLLTRPSAHQRQGQAGAARQSHRPVTMLQKHNSSSEGEAHRHGHAIRSLATAGAAPNRYLLLLLLCVPASVRPEGSAFACMCQPLLSLLLLPSPLLLLLLLPALTHQESQQSSSECPKCSFIAELRHLAYQRTGCHHSTRGTSPVAGLAHLITPLRTQVLCVCEVGLVEVRGQEAAGRCGQKEVGWLLWC